MEYWHVQWLHDFDEEPTTIYSEVGDDGYEVRKVQRYRSGRSIKADAQHEFAEIGLSEIPVGTIEEVAQQPEFAASLISKADFDAVWRAADWPA